MIRLPRPTLTPRSEQSARHRPSRLSRAVAILAAAGMFLAWMEVALPDVHDGHGLGEPESAWAGLAHDHLPAPAEGPGHAPQSPHTCHCIHAHATALPARPDAHPGLLPGSPGFPASERALASVAPEPHFRPPVV